jgi:type I restriction enzyme R subunit
MPQFAFLSAKFSEVFIHASKSESLALSGPRSACFYARLSLEVAQLVAGLGGIRPGLI